MKPSAVPLTLLLTAVISAQSTAPIDIADDTKSGSVIVDLRAVLPSGGGGSVGEPTDFKILNPKDPIVNCLAINGTILYAARLVDRDNLCREPLLQRYAKPCCVDAEPCEIWLQLSHTSAQSTSVSIAKLRLRLLDANDNSPQFRRAGVQVEVQEGERGKRIASAEFAADDPDQGDNGRLGYRLESDEELPFALENSDRRPVVLETVHALDRERKDRYMLRLLAVDSGSPRRTGTLSVTVIVTDINDETPTFEQPVYTATVSEDAPKNTPVTTVRATDRDQGANGHVTYRISPGEYAQHFAVTRRADGSGLVTLNYKLDADVLTHRDRKIDLFVMATDQGSPPRSAEVRIEVTVRDVNDERPEIEVIYLNDAREVPENVPDTPVAKIEVKDRDSDLTSLRCRVEDPDGGHVGGGFVLRDDLSSALPPRNFAGQQSRGYLLRSERPLDRELRPNVQLTIACVDSGGLNGTAVVRFRVADQNDNPPRFRPGGFRFRLPENTPPPDNYLVGVVEARDADEGENARVAYSLESSADAEAFRLDANTGQLFAVRPWDREELLRRSASPGGRRLAQVTLTVIATDSNPDHRDSATVVVTIDNLNDNRPQFDQVEYHFRAMENAPIGRHVGEVRASDADDEGNPLPGLIDYVIIAGESDEPLEYRRQQSEAQRNFRLDRRTGRLSLAQMLDREAQASFVFRVVAIDSGGSGGGSNARLTGTATVTVEVTDENDCDPQIVEPLADQVFEVPASTKPGRTLFTIQAVDNDSGRNAQIVYSLTSLAADSISVDSSSGTVLATRPLGPPGTAFEATLEARDSGSPPRFARVRVFFRVSAAEGGSTGSSDASADSGADQHRTGGGGGGGGSFTSGRIPSTRAVLLLGLLLLLLLLLAAAASVALVLLRPCRRRQQRPDGSGGGRPAQEAVGGLAATAAGKCGFESAKFVTDRDSGGMFDAFGHHAEQHYNLIPSTIRRNAPQHDRATEAAGDGGNDEVHQMVMISGAAEPYQSLRQQPSQLKHAHTYYQIASNSAGASSRPAASQPGFATAMFADRCNSNGHRGEADGDANVDRAAPFSSVDGARSGSKFSTASLSAGTARRKFNQFNPYADASFV